MKRDITQLKKEYEKVSKNPLHCLLLFILEHDRVLEEECTEFDAEALKKARSLGYVKTGWDAKFTSSVRLTNFGKKQFQTSYTSEQTNNTLDKLLDMFDV